MEQEQDRRPWIDADTFEQLIKDASDFKDKELAQMLVRDLNRAADRTERNQLRRENERLKKELNAKKQKQD